MGLGPGPDGTAGGRYELTEATAACVEDRALIWKISRRCWKILREAQMTEMDRMSAAPTAEKTIEITLILTSKSIG